MIVQPSGYIQLLKGVPLNNTYDHSIRFTSKQAQRDYFGSSAVVVKTFSNQSYTRVNKGIIRISANAEELYDCNYMAFQNNGFLESGSLNDGKWFYAFITAVEYHSNNATDITFEIDVLQTYMFDYDLAYCFVEREHTATDNISDCLVPENLGTGDYINLGYNDLSFGDWWLGVKSSVEFGEGPGQYAPYTTGYVPSINNFIGNAYANYKLNSVALNEFVRQLNENAGISTEIQSLDIQPEICNHSVLSNGTQPTVEVTASMPTLIGTYQPKNNKLNTFPYRFILADNHMGVNKIYKYENFSNGVCKFIAQGTDTPIPSVCTSPVDYAGLIGSNYAESIISKNFPTCSVSNNSYETWLAQNKTNIASQAVGGVLSAGVGAIATAVSPTHNPLPAIYGTVNLINSVTEIIGSIKKEEVLPGTDVLKAGGDGLNLMLGLNGCRFYHKSIRPEMAKVIDDYFSMFGYAVNRVKKPNLFGGGRLRPNWNYLKTVGCDLGINNCPAEAANKICNIFDNGITFWNNPANVGKYNLKNAPV